MPGWLAALERLWLSSRGRRRAAEAPGAARMPLPCAEPLPLAVLAGKHAAGP